MSTTASPLIEQHTATSKQIDSIPIKSITGACQGRVKVNDDTIKRYAEIIKDQKGQGTFPPVVVFDHDGQRILADGNHRWAAMKLAGETKIDAIIRKGDIRAAQLYAIQANLEHGLAYNNADKNYQVTLLLEDLEWRKWSDRKIGEQCHVSFSFVGNLRKKLGATSEVRKTKSGREISTTNLGKSVDPLNLSDKHVDQLTRVFPTDAKAALDKASKSGLTDKDLHALIVKHVGVGGNSSPNHGSVAYKGGAADAAVWFDTSIAGSSKPSLRGKALTAAVRDIFDIPQPQEEMAFVPKIDAAIAKKTSGALMSCPESNLHPVKAKILAIFHQLGDGAKVTREGLTKLLGSSPDVHPRGLLKDKRLSESDGQWSLTKQGLHLIVTACDWHDAELAKKSAPTVTKPNTPSAPKNHATQPALPPRGDKPAEKIPKADPRPLADRRRQKIRELIAARLTDGKIGSATPHETAALALITGVKNDPGFKYSRETVDQALHNLAIEVAHGVADGLIGAFEMPNLPPETELARIYGLDYDALVILAQNAVPS